MAFPTLASIPDSGISNPGSIPDSGIFSPNSIPKSRSEEKEVFVSPQTLSTSAVPAIVSASIHSIHSIHSVHSVHSAHSFNSSSSKQQSQNQTIDLISDLGIRINDKDEKKKNKDAKNTEAVKLCLIDDPDCLSCGS